MNHSHQVMFQDQMICKIWLLKVMLLIGCVPFFFLHKNSSLFPCFANRTSDSHSQPIRIKSIVGLIPLFATLVIEEDVLQRLPGFRKRMDWFMEYRPDIAVSLHEPCDPFLFY